MTNFEWLMTLSEEEFTDWVYDQWLHHLQYRWSSSRGGLMIWLKEERAEQTEPKCSEIPNNCETCKWGERYRQGYDITMMDDECGGCCSWNNKWTPKDEPQRDERVGEWVWTNERKNQHKCSVCGELAYTYYDELADNIEELFDYCPYCGTRMSLRNLGTIPLSTIKDEPQTDCSWK